MQDRIILVLLSLISNLDVHSLTSLSQFSQVKTSRPWRVFVSCFLFVSFFFFFFFHILEIIRSAVTVDFVRRHSLRQDVGNSFRQYLH